MRMLFTFAVCSVMIFCMSGPDLRAQVGETPQSCGDMSGQLDAIVNKAGPSDTLIVVAQLGSMENDNELNSRRLHNIEAYLTKYRSGTVFAINPNNLVLASAEKAAGNGRLSIYFKGELITIFYISKGRDLFVGECIFDTEKFNEICEVEEQKIFYPCLDSNPKQTACKKRFDRKDNSINKVPEDLFCGGD